MVLVSQRTGNLRSRNLFGEVSLQHGLDGLLSPTADFLPQNLNPLQDRVVGVVFDANSCWLLAYSDWDLKPVLYRYEPPDMLKKVSLSLPDSNLLVLKSLIQLAPDYLVAAGYREAPDGAISGREAVLVFLWPEASRAKLLPLGVEDQEDGFETLLKVSDTLLLVAGYQRAHAFRTTGRLVGVNPETHTVSFETHLEGIYPRALTCLPDGTVVVAGSVEKSRDLDAFLLHMDASGKVLQRWKSRVRGRDEALAVSLSLDGRLVVGGYRREQPWYGKFNIRPLQLVLSKQGDPTRLQGRILALSESPAGLLFMLVAGRSRNGREAALLLLEQSSNPVAFPPQVDLDVQVQDSSRDGMLSPGEAFEVQVRIHNLGKTALSSAEVLVADPPPDVQFHSPPILSLPLLFPGEYYTWQVSGRAALQLMQEGNPLRVRVRGSKARTTVLAEKNVPLIRNLQSQLPLYVQALPTTVKPGDTNQLTLVIQNASHLALHGLRYRITGGLRSMALAGDLEGQIPRLAQGELFQLPIQLSVPREQPPGNRQLPLVVSLFSVEDGFHVERTVMVQLPTDLHRTVTHETVVTPSITFQPNPKIDVEAHIPSRVKPDPNRFAVVIGIQDYKKPIPKVDFALRDAALVREYLIQAMGFPEGNVFFLPNATKSEMELYFGDEKDYRGKLYNMLVPGQSEVLVFYTGHGAPGKEKGEGNYLVPSDADARYLKLSGYSLNTFYRNLNHLPARSVAVIVDACFSGQLYANLSPVFAYVPPETRLLNRLLVLTSTSDVQPSCWLPEKQHSLFTYLFLKGIQSFQADLNRDGAISLSEVYRYLTDSRSLNHSVPYLARKLQNVDQQPRLLGGGNDFILVKGEARAW